MIWNFFPFLCRIYWVSFGAGFTQFFINIVFDKRASTLLGVFWVNIVKFKVNLRYTNCSKIIGKLRRETEFRQWRQCHCQNRGIIFFFFSNCDNGIVENGKKKVVSKSLEE